MFLYFDTIQVLSGQCYKNSAPTLITTSIRISAYLFKKTTIRCNLSFGGFVKKDKRIKNRKVRERSRSMKPLKFSQSSEDMHLHYAIGDLEHDGKKCAV